MHVPSPPLPASLSPIIIALGKRVPDLFACLESLGGLLSSSLIEERLIILRLSMHVSLDRLMHVSLYVYPPPSLFESEQFTL